MPHGAVWELMTDYYPLIAKAAIGQSSGEARRALYDRARSALVAQLRSIEPPLPEADITRERLALDEAIRKVETEAARRSRGDQPARPASPAPPRPDVPPPAEGAAKRAPPPQGLAPGAPPPAVPAPPEVPERPRAPGSGFSPDRGAKRDPLGARPAPFQGRTGRTGHRRATTHRGFRAGEPRSGREPPRPAGRRGEPPPFFDAPGGGPEPLPGLDEPLAPPSIHVVYDSLR